MIDTIGIRVGSTMGNACRGFKQCIKGIKKKTHIHIESSCCNAEVEDSSTSPSRKPYEVEIILPRIMKEIEERKVLESSVIEANIKKELMRQMSEEMFDFQQEVIRRLEHDHEKLSKMLKVELRRSMKDLNVSARI